MKAHCYLYISSKNNLNHLLKLSISYLNFLKLKQTRNSVKSLVHLKILFYESSAGKLPSRVGCLPRGNHTRLQAVGAVPFQSRSVTAEQNGGQSPGSSLLAHNSFSCMASATIPHLHTVYMYPPRLMLLEHQAEPCFPMQSIRLQQWTRLKFPTEDLGATSSKITWPWPAISNSAENPSRITTANRRPARPSWGSSRFPCPRLAWAGN